MNNDSRKLPGYPLPYKVIGGCLYREVQTKNGSYDQKLCNFLPYIVSELTLDDGAEESKRLRLGGFRQNGSPLPDIEISGSDLGSFNWLIEKWGADCILEIGPSVKDSVRYAIQMTAMGADRQTEYTVTGWKKIDGVWHFLMPGNEAHTVQLPGKLSRYMFPQKAAPEMLPFLLQLLEHPPAPREVIWPLLAYTFLSPLNHFLHEANCEPKYVFLLSGRTGTRKSTLAALFLSFFGSFTASEMPMSFRDTPNSIIYNAFCLKDVLTCIDDFHPSTRQEEQKLTATAQTIMRVYGDRTGRGRLRSDATPMASRPPQGNAVITAEFPPSVGESGTARYFASELKPDDVNLELLSAYQTAAAKGVLQSCMMIYTQWIYRKFLSDAGSEKAFLSLLRDWFEFYRDAFIRSGVVCHGRLPEITAWFQIGMKMFLWLLLDQRIITELQMDDTMQAFSSLLYRLAQKKAESIALDKPAHIFVRKLFSLIESGQATILKKNEANSYQPKDFIGYEDDDYYYLNCDSAHRAVRKLCEEQGEQFSVSSRGLLKSLAEENLIDTGSGQNTKSIRIGNTTKRVACLRKDAARRIVEEATL